MTEDEELAFEEEMLNRRKALAAAVKSSDFLTTFRASTGMLAMCETQEEKQKRESQILQDFRLLVSTKLGPQGGGQ